MAVADAVNLNAAFEEATDFVTKLFAFSHKFVAFIGVAGEEHLNEMELKLHNMKQFKKCDRKEFIELKINSKYLISFIDEMISVSDKFSVKFLKHVKLELSKKYIKVDKLLKAKEFQDKKNFQADRELDELLDSDSVENDYENENAFCCGVSYNQRFQERFIANSLNSTNDFSIDTSSHYSVIQKLQSKLKVTSSTYDMSAKSLLNLDFDKILKTSSEVEANSEETLRKVSGLEKDYEYLVTVGPFKMWKYCENNFLLKCCYEGCFKAWTQLNMLHRHVLEAHISCTCNWSCSLCDDLIDETIYEKIKGVPDMIKALQHLTDFHLLKRKRGAYLLNKYQTKLNRFIPVINDAGNYNTKDKSQCKRLFQCFKESCFFNSDDEIKSLNHYLNEFPTIGKVKCTYCDLLFKTPTSYVSHIIMEHGSSIFHCIICSYRSVSKCNVIQHELDKHIHIRPEVVEGRKRSDPINCEVDITLQSVKCPAEGCTFVTNLISKLFEHHTKEHSSNEISCLICFDHMENIEDYLRHLEVHNICTKHCRSCTAGFSDDVSLRRHTYTVHPTVVPKAIFRTHYDEIDDLNLRFADLDCYQTQLEPLVVVYLDSEISPVFKSVKITKLDDFEKDRFSNSDDEIQISAPEPVIHKEPLVLTETSETNKYYNTIEKSNNVQISQQIQTLVNSSPAPVGAPIKPARKLVRKKRQKAKLKRQSVPTVPKPDVITLTPENETIVLDDTDDESNISCDQLKISSVMSLNDIEASCDQLKISNVISLNGVEASMWSTPSNENLEVYTETIEEEKSLEVSESELCVTENLFIPLSDLYENTEDETKICIKNLLPSTDDTPRIALKPISSLQDPKRIVEVTKSLTSRSPWKYYSEAAKHTAPTPVFNTYPILKKVPVPIPSSAPAKRLVYKRDLVPVPSAAVDLLKNRLKLPQTATSSIEPLQRPLIIKNVARKSTTNGQ